MSKDVDEIPLVDVDINAQNATQAITDEETESQMMTDSLQLINTITHEKKPKTGLTIYDFKPKWTDWESKGNIARDLLAAERTWLAWLRTGLAAIAMAVSLSRFVGPETELQKLLVGATSVYLLVFGLAAVFYGYVRNRLINEKILKFNKFPADTLGPFCLVAGTLITVILFLIIVLVH